MDNVSVITQHATSLTTITVLAVIVVAAFVVFSQISRRDRKRRRKGNTGTKPPIGGGNSDNGIGDRHDQLLQ